MTVYATLLNLQSVPAPTTPVKGMAFWVETGTHWSMGTNYRVSQVNSRSFYVFSEGATQRYKLDEWWPWLTKRYGEGKMFLDGRPMDPPLAAGFKAVRPAIGQPASQPPSPKQSADDLALRDARVWRAVHQVLRDYTIQYNRPRKPGPFKVRVSSKDNTYTVVVDPAWQETASCSCPDAKRFKQEGSSMLCKHSIAVLLGADDLRGQLLDLLL